MKTKDIQYIIAHLFALTTVFIWGITFVSSKILLTWYTPLEILLLRFSLAYIGLLIIHPKVYKITHIKDEIVFIVAAITGVLGYFMLENSALVYTTISNTGLILSAAPLFVAVVSHFFTDDEVFHINLLIGFIGAIIGVGLVIFNGQLHLKVNIFGDILAVLSALVWSFYSLALKKNSRVADFAQLHL